jgi:large subunit ribosomal protein L7/L12
MVERLWSPHVKEIGDRIASLTVARARELGQYLEEVHGVKASALPAERREERQEEPDEPVAPALRQVVLEGYQPARKISVLRTLRELKQLGLREAVALLDAAPQVIADELPPGRGRPPQGTAGNRRGHRLAAVTVCRAGPGIRPAGPSCLIPRFPASPPTG